MGNAAVTGDLAMRRLKGVMRETGVGPSYLCDFLNRPHDGWNALSQALDKYGLTEERVLLLLTRHTGEREVSKFKVTKQAGAKLLVGLGFVKAKNYNEVRLQERLSKLDEIAAGGEEEKLKGDGASFKLLKAIKAAIAKGDELVIVSKEETEPTKPEKNGEAEKPSKKTKPEKEEKPAKKAKKAKGPGVCGTIKECLEEASKNKPTTKEKILKVLVKRFPDRPEAGMKSTVAGFPSWGPSYFKMEIGTDGEGGFWAQGSKGAKAAK